MSESSTNSTISSPPVDRVPRVVPYEVRLSQNAEWALKEGGLFFEGKGNVQESLARIAKRLDELNIAYTVSGGMALFLHGYRRFTEDVDLLVTRESLKRIHKELDGLGYVRPFAKSKNLRDTVSGVKIEFLLTGDYPGDGKPKDIAFPDPVEAAEMIGGVKVLQLSQLIGLKIASGLTGEGRGKDLVDVEELIKLLQLPKDFSDSLHPYAQDEYLRTWSRLHAGLQRYLLLWRRDGLTARAKTIDEMIDLLGDASQQLRAMRDDGVVLDAAAGTSNDYAYLVTTDRMVAQKYNMNDESEFWDGDEDDSAEERA